MLVIGIIFLLLTALFGLIVVSAVFKNKSTPKPMVLIHGSLAFLSLLAIASYIVAGHYEPLIITGFTLLILAGLGGATMLVIDLKGKPIPKIIAVIHPLVAVSGVICLIVYFVNS